VVGGTVVGSAFTKLAGAGWGNSGAFSTRGLYGDGYVEATITAPFNKLAMIGLSNGDADARYEDIDFAAYPYFTTGKVLVYEGGAYRNQSAVNAVAGDKFRVTITGGVIAYSLNGVTFYTSAGGPTYPMGVDMAAYTPGNAFSLVTLTGAVVTIGGVQTPVSPSYFKAVWLG
jgi:hypothetical protein